MAVSRPRRPRTLGRSQRLQRSRPWENPSERVCAGGRQNLVDIATQDCGSISHRDLDQPHGPPPTATQNHPTVGRSDVGHPVAFPEHRHEIPTAVHVGHPERKRGRSTPPDRTTASRSIVGSGTDSRRGSNVPSRPLLADAPHGAGRGRSRRDLCALLVRLRRDLEQSAFGAGTPEATVRRGLQRCAECR